MIIYFDIETIPSDKDRAPVNLPPVPTIADVKVGNRKDEKADEYRTTQLPVLVQKWEDECKLVLNKDQIKFRDTAKKPHLCEILCVVFVVDNVKSKEGYDVYRFTGTEIEIILAIDKWMFDTLRHPSATTFCGHYIKGFDLPILRMRAMKYRAPTLYNSMPVSSYEDRIIDTMDEFLLPSRGSIGMEEVCKFFGIPCKTVMKGSDVYDYYLDGKVDEVVEYCVEDTLAVRSIHKHLFFG